MRRFPATAALRGEDRTSERKVHMIKIAVVGLGKMGLSHLAIVNAQPDVELAPSATRPTTCWAC